MRQGRPIINGAPDTSAAHMSVVALVPPEVIAYPPLGGTLHQPDIIVAGSAVFDGKAPEENARAMLRTIAQARRA